MTYAGDHADKTRTATSTTGPASLIIMPLLGDGQIAEFHRRGQEIMMNRPIGTLARGRKPKARKFYVTRPDFRLGGAPGMELENKDTLLQGQRILAPPPGQQGFPAYPEPPRFVFDRKLGRPPRDLEQYHSYWLISDRMKTVLETVDPAAFAFVKCAVRFADGAPGPVHWLCDVLRILDGVDEAVSRVKIEYQPISKRKTYNLMGGASLIFKDDVVGPAHIFRLAHLEPVVISDQVLKDACKIATLKGVTFRDAADY